MKVNLAEIEIPERNLDAEQEEGIKTLAESMSEVGLSHPVLLRKCSSGEQYKVIAGERRIRAAQRLGWLIIESEIREVSEHDGKIIRLHENLRRHNLPWYEQVALVEELHSLRQAQHGVQERGKRKEEGHGWSLRDTAVELKVGLGNLSEDILLARALKTDPNLSKVKDKKTAIRLARIATTREQDFIDSLAPKRNVREHVKTDEILLGDSADILKNLSANSVDHCITDPPWIKFFEPTLTIDDRTLPVFKELYRVLKPGSMLYLFAGVDDVFYYSGYNMPKMDGDVQHIRGKLQDIGYNVASTPIIWHKQKSLSRRGVRPWEYDKDWEFIIVACKGDAVLPVSKTLSGVKPYPIVPSPNLQHPNEKPIDLIRDIITDCSYTNQIIIDPFAGSGVVGAACKKEERKYILIEREKKYYDAIVKRLK